MNLIADELSQMADRVLRGDAELCAQRLQEMLGPDAGLGWDDGLRLKALGLLAESLNQMPDAAEALLDTAQATMKLASETAGPLSQRAQAQADSWLAFAYRKLKLRDDAGHHAMKALRGARDVGDLSLEARGLLIAGMLSADRGELSQARELFQVCETRAEAAGNWMTRFWAINNQLYIVVEEAEDLARQGPPALLTEKLEAAQRLIDRAMSAARGTGNPRHEAYVLGNLATLRIVEGSFAAATESLAAYTALARALRDTRLLAYAKLDEASLLRAQGRLDEAVAALDAGHFEHDLGGNESIHVERWMRLYQLHKQRQDWRQALQCHEQLARQKEQLMAEESARLQRVLLARLDLEQAQAKAERAQLEAQAERLRAQAIERERDEHRRAALVDPLTQLGNRRALEQEWPEHEARASREAELVFVVLLDVDHFKQVNDRFGHAVGDQVLALLSQQALALLRRRDGIYRLGGEELLVLLSDSSPWGGVAAGERLRKGVEMMDWAAVAEGLKVTISLGVAVQRPGDTLSTLMERADEALYRAKNSGRNRCEQD